MRKIVCKDLNELKEHVRSLGRSMAYIVSPPSSNGEITVTFLTAEDMYDLPAVLENNGTPATRH